jgi:hypothetical protein
MTIMTASRRSTRHSRTVAALGIAAVVCLADGWGCGSPIVQAPLDSTRPTEPTHQAGGPLHPTPAGGIEEERAEPSPASGVESPCDGDYRVVHHVPLPCPLHALLADDTLDVPSSQVLSLDCEGSAAAFAVLTVRRAARPELGEVARDDRGPHTPTSYLAGTCDERFFQNDGSVVGWNRQGAASWDLAGGSLVHTVQIQGRRLVPRTEEPEALYALAFTGDTIYFFTSSAILVAERCGEGPWLEPPSAAWSHEGPSLVLADAIGSCSR